MGKWYFQKYEKIDKYFGVKIIPKNITLCKYFWSIVLCCYAYPSLVVIRTVCVPVYDFFNALYHKKPIKIKWPKIKVSSKFVRGITSAVLFGVGMVYFFRSDYYLMVFQFGLGLFLIFGHGIINYLVENRRIRHRIKLTENQRPKHHNLTLEYLKAKKGKYCPILQFYEPVDPNTLR